MPCNSREVCRGGEGDLTASTRDWNNTASHTHIKIPGELTPTGHSLITSKPLQNAPKMLPEFAASSSGVVPELYPPSICFA